MKNPPPHYLKTTACNYFQVSILNCFLMISAAFSPIIMQAPLVFPETTKGMIEASTTRRASMPITLQLRYSSIIFEVTKDAMIPYQRTLRLLILIEYRLMIPAHFHDVTHDIKKTNLVKILQDHTQIIS